ncbi:TlpA family protein disulfide reductase [Dysgonomonas sp. 216]|uniref:TlpA family protein disulfide reductase n=1 Tax=Dysgonomonas sp. 216 TaxID=2302934 RepID=UPI0013D6A304|nr:TlpA disulfide reductase family protein [Dysgonomonas sp. 216]NDW19085.1 TlpA family protein disulfide reductase [Dysgonomonas sp. 216]
MVKNNKLCYIIIGAIFLALGLIVSPLRGGYLLIGDLTPLNMSSLVGYFLYFFVTYIFLQKYTKKRKALHIFIAMLVGVSFFDIPVRIIDFKGTYLTLLDYLIHLFGIISGYIAFISTKKNRYFIIPTCFICGILLSIIGNNIWEHEVNYGTYTGKIDYKEEINLRFQDTNSNVIPLQNFRGKYFVVDCWFSRCSVCFEKMPKVQKIYDKYKNNPQVAFYSLFCYMQDKQETVTTGKKIIEKEGYTMPYLAIDIEDPVLRDQLGIRRFPVVMIFDEESRLVFKGSIEYAGDFLKDIGLN